MAPPDEQLSYLKDLVRQLNEKIVALEERAKDTSGTRYTPTPAEQLRMILVGPPGAGKKTRISASVQDSTVL